MHKVIATLYTYIFLMLEKRLIKKVLLATIIGLVSFQASTIQAQTTEESLFERDESMARRDAASNPTGGAVLLLEEKTIQKLIQNQATDLTLTIPDELDGELTLILKRRKLYTSNFRASNNTTSNIPILDLHYIGFVQDHPSSRVALSLTEKEVSGLIQLNNKTIALRSLQNGMDNGHVIYNYENHPSVPELDCSSTDTLEGYQTEKLGRTGTTSIGEPVCISIRVEVNQDFKGDPTSLLNQVASIYEKIGVEIKISEIFYWTSPSPYTGTTREIVSSLQKRMLNTNNLQGDLTILLGGKGNGGRASTVGLVCDPSAVCYSGQNDDVYTVAHELGHLLAAHHTHACKWNGNYTALDGCGFNAGYGGCAGKDPTGGGTLMSYCHIRSVGVNLQFHPQVAEVIYNFVKDHSGCTCQNAAAIVEEEYEEEYEEGEEGGVTNDQIIANICTINVINPHNCPIDIHVLQGTTQGDLLASIAGESNSKTPIIKGAIYGIYSNGLLIDQFAGNCGLTISIPSCGTEGTKVNGRVVLEGFYDTYTGEMHQSLTKQNILAKDNPYLRAPWNFKGITAITTIPANVVDWVLIMSRGAEGNIIGQSVGFLSTKGQLLDLQGQSGIPLVGAEGSYISIHHRGHMAVMSTATYRSGSALDLTTNEHSVLGNGQLKSIGKIYALHAGDFDANGVINNMDYNHWVSNSSKINQYIAADGDGNGVINNKDYNLWIANRSKIGHMPLHY